MKAVCVLAVLLAGAFQQASAVRQLSSASSLTLDYSWLPHKDPAGVWQPANETSVDFAQLTLSDLPAPEKFLEIAMTSPFPMPKIPMQLLVNNTVMELAGGKLPSTTNDWLVLLNGASNYVATNLPPFLVKFLPNITLAGQEVNVGAEASKILKGLVNGTSIELPLPEGLAGVGVTNPTVNMTLVQTVNMTLEILQKLPTWWQNLRTLVEQSVQQVQEQMEKVHLPTLQEIISEDGSIDIPGLLKSTLNITMPSLPPPPAINAKLLGEVSKALPQVAAQLGLNTTAIKFPDAAALQSLLTAANGESLFLTDKYGRVDLVATLTQLPLKVPQLEKVMSDLQLQLPPPPQGWPKLDDVVKLLSKAVSPLL